MEYLESGMSQLESYHEGELGYEVFLGTSTAQMAQLEARMSFADRTPESTMLDLSGMQASTDHIDRAAPRTKDKVSLVIDTTLSSKVT